MREHTSAEILSARTLQAARATLERHPTIGCAFLDIVLPDGYCFEFARELASRQVCIAFLSGYGRDIRDDLRATPSLTKPYHQTAVAEFLRTTCAAALGCSAR